MRTPLIAAALTAMLAAAPATAKTLTFRGMLGGTRVPTVTNSPAGGRAVVKVDTATHKVSLDLDVTGITLDQLDPASRAQPTGPVHFHQYRTPDDVEMVLPVPYGATYVATKGGFRVSLRGYDYDTGARLAETGATFDDFVNALRAGKIVVDVHTRRFPNGEISGATG